MICPSSICFPSLLSQTSLLNSHNCCYRQKESSQLEQTTIYPALQSPPFISLLLRLPPRKTTSTTYLNDLRGVAALAVLNQHHLARWYPEVLHGWQSRPQSHFYIQMPLLRIVYSGHFMVKIFFILSGYVLSYGPLKRIRKKDWEKLHHSLVSATFCRAIRLCLPTVVPFILATWLSYIDTYSYGKPLKPVSVPNIRPTLWLAYWQMFSVMVKMLNPFQHFF
jgi:peptidoglycan/LPS O-acetylase OafA/YrhL